MAPFNFGKKIRQRSNGSNQGNTSITSNESANTTIDTSRRSTSSTPLNVSGEQLFKNNILSNMLKKNDHRKVSTSSNNNDEGKSNVQRGFSNRSNETNQPKNNYPVADVGNNDVTKTVYNKVNGNNNQNGLSSPFSLQSPSFTIVADSDKHSQSKNSTQKKSLPGSKTSGRDPFGAENINKHESPDSSSSAKDIQAIQDNPDLWLTEDDMFMLKPWDRIKLPISPFPRYRHTASNVSITVNNDSDSLISSDLYLIGGLHGNSVYGDTWKLRFTRSSVNNVDILEHFNSFNKGQNDQQNISDTSHDGNLSKHHIESKKYKLACSSTSIKISNQTPPPRVGHASIMCGNAFIVFGGDTLKLNSKGEMDDDIYLFNINTKRWTVPNPVGKRPCGRYGHKISVIQHTEGMKDSSNKSSGGTKLFLFGGQFDDLYFNDLYSFNLASFRKEDSHWDVIKPMSFSPPPMSNHVMCTFDNKLYVFGGETVVGLMNDIFMYDPAINDWKFIVGNAGREQDGIPEPRQEHSCLVYKNLMCVYGGKNAQGIYLSDLWFFNFMSRKWFKFPEQKTQIMDKIKENKVSPNCLEYQPLGRSGHSMSFLQKENKILIMGGDKLDYNTTLDLNDVFAITNDIDFEEIDGEANQHIFGTTVYTFDLTCLKEFIPDIYDFNNDSSLDLLHIPSPPKVVDIPEMEDEAEVEEEEEEEEEEKSKDIVQNSTTATKERVVPRGNHIINVSRNSFPMLKNQDKITPTQPGFDIPAEENSQVGKDSAAGVSDFFDNYNDDELSVQLRNSMNSTHLLSGAMKANVIDPDISIGEESDGRELAETLSPQYHMMLEPDTIEYHQTSDMESPIPNRDNIDTRETLTGEKSFSDHDSRHSTELKSSGTEVEEQDSKVVQEKTEKHVPMKKDVVAEHVPKVSPVKKDVVVDQLPEVVQKKKDVVVDQLPKVAPIKKDVVVDQLPKVVQKNKEIAEEPQAPVIAQKQQTVKSIVIPEQNKDKDVAKSVIEPVADSTKSLEEATPSHSEKVVNDHRDNILEEILKLREETFNAAKETSNIIKNLEKQVKKLQRENEKLTNERDSMSHQVDELNMKNMELISSSADLQDSKKNIITAMKLALAQIEKGHI